MNKEKAIWWVNLLFNIHQLEFMKDGNEIKAQEIAEVKEYIVKRLNEDEVIQQ